MRILITGENHADYLAKCHEALRTGLRRTFDARPFGPGYPNYDPALTTYSQIISHIFPDAPPHLIFTEFTLSQDPAKLALPYTALADTNIPSAILLGDYWNITEHCPDGFLQFLTKHNIAHVLCYFPAAVRFFQNTPLANGAHLLLPTFDPALFTDWQLPQQYDIGFLAAGTTTRKAFYPERYRIHHQLLAQKNLKYLWANHPGWQRQPTDPPLVGANFSQAINSCKLFLTTSGRHRHPNPKYLEILASHSVLLADEPDGAADLGLIDNINYIRITEDTLLHQIQSLLADPARCEKIADAGYRLALSRHACYPRALDFYSITHPFPRV